MATKHRRAKPPVKTLEKAYQAFVERLEDAKRLLEIHEESTGTEPGRRFGYGVLNGSAVFIAVAAWEGYCQDLVRYAAEVMCHNGNSQHVLPEKPKNSMIRRLHEEKRWDEINKNTLDGIWSLAGEGWRDVYLDYVDEAVTRMGSPSYKNMKILCRRTLGIEDISAGWYAKRWKPETYQRKLDKLLKMRNEIAHAELRSEDVKKSQATDGINLVESLADWTFDTVNQHVAKTTRKPPINLRAK